MKKVLIIGALIAGGFFLFGQKKDDSGTTEPAENSTDPFVKYNRKIVHDKDGYWMLFFDGKIYTLADVKSMERFVAMYPDGKPVYDDTSLWNFYASNTTLFGGSFNV